MHDAPVPEGAPVQFKRKKKMIRPDVQWKVIAGCVGVSMVVTLVNAHFPLYGLMKFNELNANVGADLVEHMERVIVTCFALSIVLTLGLSIWLGTLLSFQFAGPIFAMKRYLLGLRDGTWGHECHLRTKDDLHDFKDALNEGIGAMRQRIVAQQEALLAAERVLDGAKPGSPQAAALEQVRVELREFSIRFEDTESIEELIEASHDETAEESTEAVGSESAFLAEGGGTTDESEPERDPITH